MVDELKCRTCGRVFQGEVVDGPFAGTCPACVARFAFEGTGGGKIGSERLELSPMGGASTLVDPEPPSLLPGATFHGLEVLGLLGRGGMGVVYKARQPALDRFVALKILSPKLAADPEFHRRFEREARALAALDHPNIVRILDYGIEHQVLFFTMDFVDGVSLRDLIHQKRLDPAEALKVVPQICEALEYAHAKGVVHRDIKPENILLDREGRVKIADFGLAKIIRQEPSHTGLTHTNVVMGTVDYMAPEQRGGLKKVDHRADIYSLGVVLYEMLTGELPVGRFEMPSRKVEVNIKIDEVVLKALENDPGRRYQKASVMGTDVRDAAAGRGEDAGQRLKRDFYDRPVRQARGFWHGLSEHDKYRLGRFGIIFAVVCMIFWITGRSVPSGVVLGCALWGAFEAMKLWKGHVYGSSHEPQATSHKPPVISPQQPEASHQPSVVSHQMEAASPGSRTSAMAVLSLLFGVLSFLGMMGNIIVSVVSSEESYRHGSVQDAGFRIALMATFFGTLVCGLVGSALGLSSLGLIRESRGTLRGRAAARLGVGAAIMSAIVLLFTIS